MDLTTADIAQNKAINELIHKVDCLGIELAGTLAALARVEKAVEELAPIINAIAAVEKLVQQVEEVVSHLAGK